MQARKRATPPATDNRARPYTTNLHSGLDDVDRRVSKHAGCSSCGPTEGSGESSHFLARVSALKPLLHVAIDKEPDHLIAALFDNGRSETLVCSSDAWERKRLEGERGKGETCFTKLSKALKPIQRGSVSSHSELAFLPHYRPHTVQEAPVFWVGLRLVVNKLDLDSLHWTNNGNSLAHAGAKTRQETLCLLQVALLISHSVLKEFKHGESEGRERESKIYNQAMD